jgi:glycosyltransferase involved in cell wall biosynthesis
MKIGINCLKVNPNYQGGVNTYVHGLIQGLIKTSPNDQIVLFVHKRNRRIFNQYCSSQRVSIVEMAYRNAIHTRLLNRIIVLLFSYRVFRVYNRYKFGNIAQSISKSCDVIYSPSATNFPYYYSIPSVVSLHDLLHLNYPSHFTFTNRKFRGVTYRLTVETAHLIQASSVYIKNDILANYKKIQPEDIEVISEGVDLEYFKFNNYQSNKNNIQLPEKYLLYPAQAWKHKNHINLFMALRILKDEYNINIPLILTGALTQNSAQAIIQFIEKNHDLEITHLGLVEKDYLKHLYKQATYLILPTYHESSSLPIYEAMACGTPIIAANIPAISEMSEVFEINLFDPTNPERIAQVIRSMWKANSTVDHQVIHNSKIIEDYSWDNIARKYTAVFKKVCL